MIASNCLRSRTLWFALFIMSFVPLIGQVARSIGEGDIPTTDQSTISGGQLYYVRRATPLGLIRSSLDGSNRTVVASLTISSGLASLNGKVYFVSSKQRSWDAPVVYSLTVSDGTTENTYELAGIPADAQTMRKGSFAVARGRLYFILQVNSPTPQLWSTDGSMGGAHLLKQFAKFGNPEFTLTNDSLFFTANDGLHGLQLWVVDLATDEVRRVSDSKPYGNSSPRNLFAIGGKVFFSAANESASTEVLWGSDGTAAGTHPLFSASGKTYGAGSPLVHAYGQVYFASIITTLSPNPNLKWLARLCYFDGVSIREMPDNYGAITAPQYAYGRIYFNAIPEGQSPYPSSIVQLNYTTRTAGSTVHTSMKTEYMANFLASADALYQIMQDGAINYISVDGLQTKIGQLAGQYSPLRYGPYIYLDGGGKLLRLGPE